LKKGFFMDETKNLHIYSIVGHDMKKVNRLLKAGGVLFSLILMGCNITAKVTANANINVSTQYQVGGVVLGLSAGDGIVLQNNLSDSAAITGGGTGNDPFTFPTKLLSGESYNISVFSAPLTKTCVAGGNLGTVANMNISSIQVTCSNVTIHTVGGSISNLSGTGLTLKNTINGVTADFFSPNPGAVNYTFPSSLTTTNTYNVTVFSQPANPSQNCTVSAPSGTMANTNVTGVNINCTTNTYTTGGTISGLLSTESITLSDGILPVSGSLTLGPGAPLVAGSIQSFNFPAKADKTAYNITVTTPPAGKTCAVTNGAGTLTGSNAINVFITCSGGGLLAAGGNATTGISGLAPNATIGLNLTSSVGITENLSVTNGLTVASTNQIYSFLNTFATGASVTVSIASQPVSPHQTCTFPAAALTTGAIAVGAVNVNLPLITCTTNTYTVAGTVSGLTLGDTVGLQLNSTTNGVANAAQTFTTAAATGVSMPFTFATPITDGSAYTVTVTSFSPAGKTCGAPVSGVLSGAANVAITCAVGPTVSVTVSGFTGAGGSLGLRLNGSTASNILAGANGVFTFTTPVLNTGNNYSVSIFQQPDRLNLNSIDQQCYLSPNASGVIPVVGTITATCSPVAYAITGKVIGLVSGDQSVVYNNTTNIAQLVIANGFGTDTYSLPVTNDGSDISIKIMQSPPGKTCVFSNGTDNLKSTVWGTTVTQDIACTAVANAPVYVTVLNLTGSNTLNVTNTTNVPGIQTAPLTTANNKIAFAMTAQAVGSTFALTLTQPATQICVFVSGSASGTMTSAGNSVVIDCANPAKPDFTVTINSVSIGGGGLTVSYTVNNIGAKTAVNPKVAFWVNLAAAPTDVTAAPTITIPIYGIIPTNAVVSGTQNLAIGALTAGTVYAYIDYNGTANGDFMEALETNNASLGVAWTLPDLTIAINAVGGITGTSQQTITVNYTVTNTGAYAVGPFVAEVWTNSATAPALCCGTTRNTHPGLAAGATLVGSRIIPVSTMTGGTAYVSVDSTNIIPELNEANNVSTGVAWLVTAGPALAAQGTALAPIGAPPLTTGYLGTALNAGANKSCFVVTAPPPCSYYVINGLTAGTSYNIQLTNVSNDIDIYTYSDAFVTLTSASWITGVFPESVQAVPTGTSLWVIVDPWGAGGGFYTISYNPAPWNITTGSYNKFVTAPNADYYTVSGLVAGSMHTITVIPDVGTGDVSLDIYSGPNGLTSTGANNSTSNSVFLPVDQQCTSATAGNATETCLVAIPASSTSLSIKVTGVVSTGYTLKVQ